MQNIGSVYLIYAPSGAGKTSLVNKLLEMDKSAEDKIRLSISHTTRLPRKYEVDGEHYYFVSQEKFNQLIKQNIFLEYANVYGNLYGTSKNKINQLLENGFDIILEIDWQGAKQVKKTMKEAISICIAPPSIQDLRNRLEARGSDSQKVIENRMKKATNELKYLTDANYVIINDNFSDSVNKLYSIFVANRQTLQNQKPELKQRDFIKR